jgi:hypothetical protein
MPVINNGMNFSGPPTKPAPVLYSRQTAPFSFLGAKVVAKEEEAALASKKLRAFTQIKRCQVLLAEEARKRLQRARTSAFSPGRISVAPETVERQTRVEAVAAKADEARQRAKPARPSSAPGWRVAKAHESSGYAEVGDVVPMFGRRNIDPGRCALPVRPLIARALPLVLHFPRLPAHHLTLFR